MRPIGIVLLVAGLLLVFSAFVMGSTVETYPWASGIERYGIISPTPQQTYNMPKAQTQMMLHLTGLAMALAGVALVGMGASLDAIKRELESLRRRGGWQEGATPDPLEAEAVSVAKATSAGMMPGPPHEPENRSWVGPVILFAGFLVLVVIVFVSVASLHKGPGTVGVAPAAGGEVENLEEMADRLEAMANEAER